MKKTETYHLDSTITIRLFAGIVEDEKMKVIPLEKAHVSLRENDAVLYDGISGAQLKLAVYPKAGARYYLTVTHERYPAVTAETRIPEPVKCKAIYMGNNSAFPRRARRD
jgi:hypothetical protein